MKNTILALASLSLFSSSALAAKMYFPDKDEPQFTITIPNDWKPETVDGVLEAISPDDNVYLAAWELATKKDLESLGKDIEDMLKDHAKKIKIVGEPEKAKVGGTMEGLLFNGTAKDKEDGKDISFYALVFSPDKEHAAVIFIEAGADTTQAQASKLTNILKSIKPGKGE